MSSYFGDMPDYLKNISLGDCMYKAYKFCCEKFGDTFADSDNGRLFVHILGVKDYQFLLKLKKEQEKMKKYEINLQEVAEDLSSYFKCGVDLYYGVYVQVDKIQNCIFVKNIETKNDVVVLKWHTDEGLDWENRWGVQTVESQYYSSQGEMTLYKLAALLNDLDDFINSWYGQNQEPEPDMKRDLPQVIKSALLTQYKLDALQIDVTMSINTLGDDFINLEIKTPSLYQSEQHVLVGQVFATYLIKGRSAFVVDMRVLNDFLTKSEEINTIVRKCVMEWDK